MAIRMSSRRGSRSGMRLGTKILLIAVVVLGVLTFVGYRFYLSIQSQIWSDEDAAVQTAMAQTSLKSVDRVDSYVGDAPMMIVEGADGEGRSMLVWVAGNETHSEFADAGVTKEWVRKQTLMDSPGVELLRIVPAMFNGDYAWQSFYRMKGEDGKKKLYYNFYRFKDGALLDKWLLSLQ
ncbi:cell wall elongation regulator TseB-like domain-containing protein [Gorillibacterium sp. sgz500922]|uniref:cell wall elongation regulator TseB-like domain-containing protein n=1 Tax=Gorillibacterium sp. sgz500922 TaxID=3446694 RepID=UPI003F67AFAC